MENSRIEPELIDSKQLAKMINMSVKFIEKNRPRIAGAMKIGKSWRFDVQQIRARIATGRDIITR